MYCAGQHTPPVCCYDQRLRLSSQETLSTFTYITDGLLAVVITHYVATDIPELIPGTGAVSANANP
jgi:hypothetical protein